MKKIQHPTNNDVLAAPEGIPIEQCSALPITRMTDESGFCWCVSFWMPDHEELASLLAGRPMMLMVAGTTHPPVFPTVESRHAQG